MATTKTINLKITTIENVFFEGDVRSVTLRTKTGGAICLLPGISAFASNIAIGKLTINSPGDKDYHVCSVGGGLVFADRANIRIITDDIIFGENIDIVRAQKDRDSALDLLSSVNTNKDKAKLEIKLRKALNRIKVYDIEHSPH